MAKGKQTCIDILTLSNKERKRLCEEIHNLLLQKVQIEQAEKQHKK